MAVAKSEFGKRFKTVFDNAVNAIIAGKLGVSEDAVGTYVRGRVPNAEILEKTAKLTKCNLHWLLTGDGPQFVGSDMGGAVSLPAPLVERLKTIAEEQARVVYSDVEIAGQNINDATLKLLVEYLLHRALVSVNLVDQDTMSAADRKRAERFAFAQNEAGVIEANIREMIRREVAGKSITAVATETDIRDMIRELVKEEVSRSRKRPVYSLQAADSAGDENLDESARRKAG